MRTAACSRIYTGRPLELEKVSSGGSVRLEPTQAGERPQQARSGKTAEPRPGSAGAEAGDSVALADHARSRHDANARWTPPTASALIDLSGAWVPDGP
jgi:hypothetical protein